ncbi:helix-turn-helix transcriptional regulator [Lichenifustis flavocetrariae]|uniref:Helix-turn-helix transcriptional regulator n=1 Tax=Lichenifustis flavocetrariae TaxID=2949735 RepID=A0AA41Z1S0_9HYPH|nr:helix-turn-helix transcriptional regulator [Lichenifustis flavocetrariae]MCW6508785.1 helix-turn-helix transcriptional regulator [Lichenifustis flavocetrariae]
MGGGLKAELGSYGDRIAEAFHLDAAPTLRARTLHGAPIAVTELRCDRDGLGVTSPLVPEEAFVVALQLQPYHGRLWVAGRRISTEPMQAGAIGVHDISQSTIADLQTSFHCLQFYLPQTALDKVARDAGHRAGGGLNSSRSGGITDPVLHTLGLSLLPSLEEPATADPLFVDHVSWALTAHVCRFYGGLPVHPNRRTPCLAPWQEKLVKEVMAARLDGALTLTELAALCQLSVSHFTRAFGNTVGTPPYRWLLDRRLERAMALLSGAGLSLIEISLACGFANQSHFTRTFTRYIGVSPGEWRRQQARKP